MKYLTILLIFLSACGKSSSPAAGTASEKSIDAQWELNNGAAVALDMSAASFTAPFTVTWTFLSGAKCQSTVSILAYWETHNTSGQLLISGSTTLVYNPSEPACSGFDGTVTYNVLSTGQLILCTSANLCDFYN